MTDTFEISNLSFEPRQVRQSQFVIRLRPGPHDAIVLFSFVVANPRFKANGVDMEPLKHSVEPGRRFALGPPVLL